MECEQFSMILITVKENLLRVGSTKIKHPLKFCNDVINVSLPFEFKLIPFQLITIL